jgi:hypothetical protein
VFESHESGGGGGGGGALPVNGQHRTCAGGVWLVSESAFMGGRLIFYNSSTFLLLQKIHETSLCFASRT